MSLLIRRYLEKYEPETKDVFDKRKKISLAVFSYFDELGNEYRKSFKSKPNEPEKNFWEIAPKTLLIKNKT